MVKEANDGVKSFDIPEGGETMGKIVHSDDYTRPMTMCKRCGRYTHDIVDHESNQFNQCREREIQ